MRLTNVHIAIGAGECYSCPCMWLWPNMPGRAASCSILVSCRPSRRDRRGMPLVAMQDMLAVASQRGYAICYCESWNLESFQAVIEGAEELGAPVIVGFNGGFLMHRSRSKPENLASYAGMASSVRNASVPVSLILNESDDFLQIASGIELGFNAVMVESHHLGFEDYKNLVKRVVSFGKDRGVFVEGQIGQLPHGWNGGQGNGVITDPRLARLFVEETRVHALSVSIGNV